jgi:hypothetical protein
MLMMDLLPDPLPPTNLTATPGYRKTYLKWAPNANDTLTRVPTYEVYRATRLYSYEDPWELIGVVPGEEEFIDEDVEFDHSYYYRVVTRFEENRSIPTDHIRVEVEFTVPAPIILEAKVENGTVTLRWELPEPDYSEHVKEFVIHRGSERDSYGEVFEHIKADDRTWTDRWVKEGNTYSYSIEAELFAESYTDPDESERSDIFRVRVPYSERTEVEGEKDEDWIMIIIIASIITFVILAAVAVVLYLLPVKGKEGESIEE